MPDDPRDAYASLSALTDGRLSLQRRAIAARLGAISTEAVPVTLMRSVRVTAARPFDELVLAAVRALREHPGFNGVFEDDRYRTFAQVNLGLAFDTPNGLLVPVVGGVQDLDAEQLRAARTDLARRVADRAVTMADLTGGTFTISNLGGFGIEYFTPVLNPPQVAILGVGAFVPTADGATRVPLSLTFDHRVNDGAAAALLLRSIQDHLTDREPLGSGVNRV
jgi:pyruvate dehydrogenase E2 component (dihydrolipoamide acetyltransferase)